MLIADQFEIAGKRTEAIADPVLEKLLDEPPEDQDEIELSGHVAEIDDNELRKYVEEDSPLSSPSSERGLSSLPIAGATVTVRTRAKRLSSPVRLRLIAHAPAINCKYG